MITLEESLNIDNNMAPSSNTPARAERISYDGLDIRGEYSSVDEIMLSDTFNNENSDVITSGISADTTYIYKTSCEDCQCDSQLYSRQSKSLLQSAGFPNQSEITREDIAKMII